MDNLNKLPELNLKSLTSLDYYPTTINIGSVNFHTNFNVNMYMNNTNNKNNPNPLENSSSGYSSFIESLMNPLTATLTNPTFLSSLSSLSSSNNKTDFYTPLERSKGVVPGLYDSIRSSSTGSSYSPNYTHSYTPTSTGPSSTSSTCPSSTSSTGHSSDSSEEESKSRLFYNYNILDHVYTIDGDSSKGFKISCSRVPLTERSQFSTENSSTESSSSEVSQSEKTQEHVTKNNVPETTESSVVIENEN